MGNVSGWKDAGKYEYTKKLDMRGWAWEFLRRNPEYQKDYQHWCSVRANVESTYGNLGSVTPAKRSEIVELIHYSPPKRANEDDQAWYQRCIAKNLDPWKLALDAALGKKWGLYDLYDPASKKFTQVLFRPRGDIFVTDHFEKLIEKVEFPIRTDVGGSVPKQTQHQRKDAFALFDLTCDLVPQFDLVRVELMALRDKKKLEDGFEVKIAKPKFEKWGTYLRVLDARKCLADWKVIGEVIFEDTDDSYPDRKAQRKARDTFRQAMKISKTEYRTLIP